MKKRALSLALALVLVLTLIPAALADETDKPQRGVLTYTEYIAPQYEELSTFSEDLAAAKKDGKWGYIDKDNKVVIPFQYELAYSFNEGYAVVAKSVRQETYGEGTEWEGTDTYYKMGFIDKAGKYTPFIGTNFDGQTGESGIGELEVSEISLNTRVGHFFYNGYCVINYQLFRPDGSVVELGKGEYYPIGPVTEGLVPVRFGSIYAGGGGEGVGWADPATGGLVKVMEGYEYLGPEIPNEWGGTSRSCRAVSFVYPFNQGLAPVQMYTYDAQTGDESNLWGFMDRNYQWVIEPQFDNFYYRGVESLSEMFGDTGLATMGKDGKYGAIDQTGAVKIPFQYEELWPVSSGLFLFKQGGKYGYLNAATLETVIPARYEKATGFNDSGYAVAYDGSKAFLIDRKGNPIPGADSLDTKVYFREDAQGAKVFSTPGEYVVIEKNGKCGFGHIEYLQPLPEKDEMDNWAYDEVVAAIENDLVPSYLQNLYLNDIKRGEFCDVVIQALEAVLDKDIEDIVKEKTGEDIANYQHSYPFVDTTDTNTLAANKLGIVNGKGNGVFDPYANITRQEAAAMLMRAAKVLEMKNGGDGNTSFTDSDQIESWAVEAVEYICKAGIMNGEGQTFNPTGSYSREQSFMTIYRLFQRVMGQE